MTSFLTEDAVEQSILSLFEELGFDRLFGPDISPDGPQRERQSYGDIALVERLQSALERLNPHVPSSAIDDAVRKVTIPASPSLIENNRTFHKQLIEGVPVQYHNGERNVDDHVRLIDFNDPQANEWLAVNQYTVIEDKHNRRPDVVVMVNGLPLAVIELKNPADENATVKKAFNQLQTYKQEIPSLFTFNELLVISDGLVAKIGTLTADWEWFMPWRTVDGVDVAPPELPQLDVMVQGVFDKRRFLDLIRYFIVFDDDGSKIIKKVAGYHQYHAVNKAVECTVQASSPEGDKRIGVIWHTQGSGKSLSMAFYAGRIIQHPSMENPTILVITDRNDLDEQLFGTFARCEGLLRQEPVQAGSRSHLRELLSVASGGVVFSTIQKFFPEEKGDTYPLLSDRSNIVVIADEAHRSQYDFIDGFARHLRDGLPNASFIGFTGTPIESDDKSTGAVFGEYIDVYDIQRAVEDGATVRIYYEGRLAKIELEESQKPKIDPDFEEVTEGEEAETKESLKRRWAQLEAMVGTPKRLALIAEDLVGHFEDRLSAMDGKAMIVCMSRRICVDLYEAITKLRPDWHHDDDNEGAIKVVMTGSASDPLGWQQHVRNKPRRKALAERFKKSSDPLRLVIVRDMWLTGFDAPCLHTMYVDKPMRGHGLMQAIARVNRVFKDKPGGLVVDYLGLADQLKKALSDYTEGGGKGKATIDQEEAVAVMKEKYEVVCDFMHGFDCDAVLTGPMNERMAGVAAGVNYVVTPLMDDEDPEDRKKRYMAAVTALSQAFALSVPHPDAIAIRDHVGLFQAIRAGVAKLIATGGDGRKSSEEIDSAIRQIVSKAVASDEVIDIFAAAGLKKPDISILSDEFLEEVKGIKHRNLAIELLRKLLNDEISVRSRKNTVQARSFAEMLEQTIRRYQNRSIETAQVIAELVEIAKDMREAQKRGDQLGLTEDEVAFYDALEVNDSAVKVLGDDTLKLIARELVEAVRRNVTIDWTVRENARAGIRVIVKRILRKFGYPPDKQAKATETVLSQAEVLCAEVTG